MSSFKHFPSIRFQLVLENKHALLLAHIDSEIDDLKRNVEVQEYTEFLNRRISISFEGFESYTDVSDNEKTIDGTVYINFTCDKTNVIDQYKLASPSLLIKPIKATKNSTIWPSIVDIKHTIDTNWQNSFIEALDNLHEQVLSSLNSTSHDNQINSHISISDQNFQDNSALRVYGRNVSSRTNWRITTGNKLLDNTLIGSLVVLILSIAGTKVYSTVFSSKQSENLQQVSGLMTLSPEEMKNQRLKELGIDPATLNQDLGCFAGE